MSEVSVTDSFELESQLTSPLCLTVAVPSRLIANLQHVTGKFFLWQTRGSS